MPGGDGSKMRARSTPDGVSRRDVLTRGAGLLLSGQALSLGCRPRPDPQPRTVEIRLRTPAPLTTPVAVAFGVPLPRGLMRDPDRVRVFAGGREVMANVEPIEPWRTAGRDGTVRALAIRTRLDLSAPATRTLTVRFDTPGAAPARGPVVDFEATTIDVEGRERPRVETTIDPAWLCASGVVGPQAIARVDGPYGGYEQFVERSFPESRRYLDSDVYHHWLFDRTTAYATQYVRTGDARFLDAAQQAAQFMRRHSVLDGPDAGHFALKGVDVKYVYPRGMHVHALLTGDPRSRAAAATMARFCLTHWDPVYRSDRYVQPPFGTDPEAGRAFWSPRHEAYGLLGVCHGWELTGDRVYWDAIRAYVDALHAHQQQPPDGRPGDGSFRQNWALYDPNESLLEGATSPWMMAILVDALFHAWLLTEDARIPMMIVRWCDVLDRKGFVADGSRAYYVMDCLGEHSVDEAPGAQEQGMERHSTELAMTFAMGLYFTKDSAQATRFRQRFDRLYRIALTIDANHPVRAYNWAFQASSRLVYFMDAVDGRGARLG